MLTFASWGGHPKGEPAKVHAYWRVPRGTFSHNKKKSHPLSAT